MAPEIEVSFEEYRTMRDWLREKRGSKKKSNIAINIHGVELYEMKGEPIVFYIDTFPSEGRPIEQIQLLVGNKIAGELESAGIIETGAKTANS